MAGAATALETHNVPYNLAIFDINVDQAPTAARRCLELVRNSHVDLQDLIRLRASSLHLLTGAHPAALQRVDAIIQIASNSLVEVCQLVEKLRPETENGKTTLMGRLGWKLVDSRKFKSLEPHILQQQNSVLAELSYLRQLILMRQPPMEGSNAGGGDAAERAMADEILSGRHLEIIPRSPTDWDKVYVVGDTRQEANKIRIERRPVTAQVPMMGGARTVASAQRPAVVWDNIGLLDEMFGGGTSVNPPSAMSTAAVNDQAPLSVDQARQHSNSITSMTPPPPYSRNRSSSTLSGSFQSLNVSRPSPLSRNINMAGPNIEEDSQGHERAGSGASSKFDPDGASLLFSDFKPFVPLSQSMPPVLEQPFVPLPQSMPPPPQQQPFVPLPQFMPQSQQQRSAPFTRRAVPPPPHLARSYQQLQSGSAGNQVSTDTQPAEPKTLSTIPQDLIFRRDGVKYPSPPNQDFAVPVMPPNTSRSEASRGSWSQTGTSDQSSELNGASSDPLDDGPNPPMTYDSNPTTLSQPHQTANNSPQPQPQSQFQSQIQQQKPTRDLPASFRDRMQRMPPSDSQYRDQTREAQSNPKHTSLTPVREPGQSSLEQISLLPPHPTFSPLLATHLGNFNVSTDSIPQLSQPASFESQSRVPPPPHLKHLHQPRAPSHQASKQDFAQNPPINKTSVPSNLDPYAQAAETPSIGTGSMIPSWSQAGSGPQAIDPYFMTQGSVRYIGPSSVGLASKSREQQPEELSSVKFAPDASELDGISVATSPGGEPREMPVGEVWVPVRSRAELE